MTSMQNVPRLPTESELQMLSRYFTGYVEGSDKESDIDTDAVTYQRKQLESSFVAVFDDYPVTDTASSGRLFVVCSPHSPHDYQTLLLSERGLERLQQSLFVFPDRDHAQYPMDVWVFSAEGCIVSQPVQSDEHYAFELLTADDDDDDRRHVLVTPKTYARVASRLKRGQRLRVYGREYINGDIWLDTCYAL